MRIQLLWLAAVVLLAAVVTIWAWPGPGETWFTETGHCYRVVKQWGRSAVYAEIRCP